jgi:hypothetical protein
MCVLKRIQLITLSAIGIGFFASLATANIFIEGSRPGHPEKLQAERVPVVIELPDSALSGLTEVQKTQVKEIIKTL